ncbi:Cold-regulated 413 protein [Dioscorea alata]|uniref:Cold-regulated 413 protein n=2 Tax=Dioscorea alata TaxID=55571 RepID=A0ACB7WN06_DIOAL|nr:Cold-regulated 413 protein [Dioscorea alata]KAH7689712.1 Cold-regulated 413 protein [Dioscorea alata]
MKQWPKDPESMGFLAMKTDQIKSVAHHNLMLGSDLRILASLAAIGDIGKWIAFIAVVLRLFFPRHFPDWLEMPGSLILLLVVAPGFFADTLRHDVVGVFICLVIGCYLLQEHIKASGCFRNSLTTRHGISNTIGIILLLVYPVWCMLTDYL